MDLSGVSDRRHELYLLDESHDMTKAAVIFPDNGKFTLTMAPNTVVVIR